MTFSTGTLSALNGVLADLSMPNPLGATALIDVDAPGLRTHAQRIAGEGDALTRAVRVHDHVRDGIAFAFDAHPWALSASRVLARGAAHSIPKATLFAALLRAVDIPARIRFVSVDAGLLRGLMDLAAPRMEHALVEVWLEERWLACDSYAVDADYFDSACRQLRSQRRAWGLGIHVDGRVEWTGRSASFSQLVTGGPDALPDVVDLGVHADAAALYARGAPEATRPGLSSRLDWRLRVRGANQRIRELRAAA